MAVIWGPEQQPTNLEFAMPTSAEDLALVDVDTVLTRAAKGRALVAELVP